MMYLALAVAALTGWLIPAAVDLATKSRLPSGVKALLAFVLATLDGVLTTTAFMPGSSWHAYLITVAFAFVNAMAAHTTGYSNPIQRATAGFGLGPTKTPAGDPLNATETAQRADAGVITYTDSGGG